MNSSGEGRAQRSPHGPHWSIYALALLFAAAGVLHFVVPRPFERIVPTWIPDAPLVVAISGIAEALGGIGLLVAGTRRMAGVGLIALLIAVFPANVHMLQLGYTDGSSQLWQAFLWIRLPLQPLLIWWVWRVAARPGARGV
ncbi:MAG: hypothetical protein M3081_14370 [Gemmatimonadota bacterium]|nr:hypothetical protein [Gemmatimonadota bacterium]